jgi:hypothetical protein
MRTLKIACLMDIMYYIIKLLSIHELAAVHQRSVGDGLPTGGIGEEAARQAEARGIDNPGFSPYTLL